MAIKITVQNGQKNNISEEEKQIANQIKEAYKMQSLIKIPVTDINSNLLNRLLYSGVINEQERYMAEVALGKEENRKVNTERDYANDNANSEWGEYTSKFDIKENASTPSKTTQNAVSNNQNSNYEIKDETDTNIISPITSQGYDDYINFLKEQQKAQWEREDQIRKEIQEREDNAWQRSVEDAQKAGINPNLINLTPASSGGGITSATGIDYSPLTGAMTAEGTKYTADIEAETANKQIALQKELAEINNELQKWVVQYGGDLEKAIEEIKNTHSKELAEIEQNYSKELAEIEQNYSKEIKEIEQKFTREENKKSNIIKILGGLLTGIISIFN